MKTKFTTQQKVKINKAKKLIEDAAEILGELESEFSEASQYDFSAGLEEVGIALGSAISDLQENFE